MSLTDFERRTPVEPKKKTYTSKLKFQRNPDSFFLANLKEGETFYTESPDKSITALAIYYKRKVSTERMIAIKASGKIEGCYITRVTIVS